MRQPQFRQSIWRQTSQNAVCSVTLCYNGLMHQTQIRIPLAMDSHQLREDCIKAAQDKLWEELYIHKKGFEPISKQVAIDGTEVIVDPLMKVNDNLGEKDEIQLD